MANTVSISEIAAHCGHKGREVVLKGQYCQQFVNILEAFIYINSINNDEGKQRVDSPPRGAES